MKESCEKIEKFNSNFKLKFFGPGEWVDELDQVKFTYRGYDCLVFRVVKEEIYAKEEAYFGGHLCGYVLIPNTNCLYDKNLDEIEYYGGCTFDEKNEKGRLIGFDCAHCNDYIPSMKTINLLFNQSYKNVEFCVKECKNIVDQLLILEDGFCQECKNQRINCTC